MRFELREDRPAWLLLVVPLLALAFSFVLGALAIAWGGASPSAAYWQILVGALGSKVAASETLIRATPLLFTGLAVAVAFRSKLWNIGGEGQLYAGGLMAVALGASAPALPSLLLIPALMICAALAGAALLLGPTILKTRFGVDEVVTTLLLNFITLLFVSMMLDGPMKDPMSLGYPKSAPVIDEVLLPQILAGSRLHLGLVIGIVAAVAVYVLNTRTVWGFEMKAVGSNPGGALFLGIPVERTFVLVALLSGSLAGLAGGIEVLGLRGDLSLDFSPGFGYSGIIVAMLASLNPLAILPCAVFVAGIFVGADAMSRVVGLSSYIANVITAISLISMLVASILIRYRIRF